MSDDADVGVREQVEDRLEEIESDNRLHYDPADVRVNAPLALIQTQLKAQKGELEWFLSLLKEESSRCVDTGSDHQ